MSYHWAVFSDFLFHNVLRSKLINKWVEFLVIDHCDDIRCACSFIITVQYYN